jgi:iron complex outermembrane receptor protein
MKSAFLRFFSILLFVSSATAAPIRGVVLDPDGKPIEKAYVQVLETGLGNFTAADGGFFIDADAFPLQLEVVHPNFESAVVPIELEPSQTYEIILQPKLAINEVVVVTAKTPGGGFSPVGTAATTIDPRNPPLAPSTLTELVESVPGVSENGQGGIFQVYSIRGVSRERIQSTISGVRLTSERRAGVSASFLDPILMANVDLQRGPASSYFGSGALGGVVQVLPRNFDRAELETGYDSQGNENFQFGGWGNRNWSLGFVRRSAGNGRTPDGSEINTHFTLYSTVIESNWTAGNQDYTVMLIPALARDVGKANTDFPSKTTNYPEEKHLVARFAVKSQKQWELAAYVHPHDLHTRVTEGMSQSDVFNDTLDFGFAFDKQMRFGRSRFARLGVDYFGRRFVNSLEQSRPEPGAEGSMENVRALDDARNDELGLHGLLSLRLGRATFEGGARFSWFNQRNADLDSIRRTTWNGYAGILVPLAYGIELNGAIGTGLRMPSLSERFFSGTTGRGQIIGNPLLDPERSLNLDAGIRWYGSNSFAAAYYFRNRIQHYIERIELEPDVLSFENLTSGTLRGVEWEAATKLMDFWDIYGRGHVITGRDQSSDSLADIPANRGVMGTRFLIGRWDYGTELQLRCSKSNPGSGEKEIPSAQIWSAFMKYSMRSNLQVSLSASNLLNQSYFNSADRKVSLSAGRGFAISLRWIPD